MSNRGFFEDCAQIDEILAAKGLTEEQESFRDTTCTYHMDNHRNVNVDVWTVYEGGGTYGTRHNLRDDCTAAEAEAYVRTLRAIDPEAK